MAKRYDVRFIICEDIRVEANGKVSLAGIFPGELIILLQNVSDAELPAGLIAMLPRLCFVFFVKGPPGSVDVSITVYSPDRQKTIVESKQMTSQIEQGKTATIGITGSTFPVSTLGTYVVELKIGDEPHEFGFVIDAGPNFVQNRKPTAARARKRSAKSVSRRSRS